MEQPYGSKVYNGSTCNYHFIIRELAKEFKGKFKCLGENTGKYITFSVPKLDSGKTIKYKIKFIHSFRFMSGSLSDVADNLSERIYNNKIMKNIIMRKILIKI